MGNTEAGDSPISEDDNGNGDSEEKKKKKKDIWKGLGAALTGGLDAVYGSGKVKVKKKTKVADDEEEEVCKDDDGNVIACK